jgi:hypothetical protein
MQGSSYSDRQKTAAGFSLEASCFHIWNYSFWDQAPAFTPVPVARWYTPRPTRVKQVANRMPGMMTEDTLSWGPFKCVNLWMAWNCFCLLNTPSEAPISPAISVTNNKPTSRGEHRVVEQTARLIHWTDKGHDKNIYQSAHGGKGTVKTNQP